MQIVHDQAVFPSIKDAAQVPIEITVNFPVAVTQAAAILTGFNAQYTRSDGDHHLGQLDVRLTTSPPQGTSVLVTVTFDLRDWSNNRDDQYEGTIWFAVVAE